jgi:NADPH:quinone reductase-like Zn-dependent oxidoreductase
LADASVAPATMKRLVLVKPGSDIASCVLQDEDKVPVPIPGPGEVLIKVVAERLRRLD